MNFELKKYDTSTWKEFKLKDFFFFEKGQDLSPNKSDVFSENSVKCLVAKNNNCGIGGYKINPTKTWNKDSLSLIAQGDGGAGLSYYVDAPFCANKCVWVLIPKDNIYFNKYVGLFLSTILSKYKTIFSHSNGLTFKKLSNLSIKLPVDCNGEPDWEYMRKEVKCIQDWTCNKLLKEIISFQNIELDTSKWKEFKLNDDNLFDLYSSKNSLDKIKIVDVDDQPKDFNYISRSDVNNGINLKVCKQNIEINKGHCLTIGLDTQTSFYQEQDFYTGQNIQILRIRRKCSKYTYLFLSSIIKLIIKNKFQWGSNGATLGRLKKLSIKLPVDHNGEPDWEYMENYIKSLPYIKYLK